MRKLSYLILIKFMLSAEIDMPQEVLESFGEECAKAGLVNSDGIFNDPYKLVAFFCK